MSVDNDPMVANAIVSDDIKVLSFERRKRRILLTLLAYATVIGAITQFLPEDDRVLNFLIGIPITVLAYNWCQLDAKQRGYTIGRYTSVFLILLFVIAFPILMLRTRGLRGLWTLTLSTLFAASMLACSVLIELVLEFTSWGIQQSNVHIGYLLRRWEAQ
jgi:hypothetical protein